VQTIIPLGSGNGALRLTTARYFTPSVERPFSFRTGGMQNATMF
jgi:hypothetical protein